MYYQSYFVFLLPLMLFAFYAQSKVKSTYKKYSNVRNMRNMTGLEVATRMLQQNGIHDVSIEKVGGVLSDHYDPRKKVVRLSQGVHDGTSVASASIAAHEIGHVIQHDNGYVPLQLRSSIAPAVTFGTKYVWFLIIGGVFFNNAMFLDLGILVYAAVAIFHLITLPVEFNASARAQASLEGYGILQEEELSMSKKVLNAAALTYIAATAVAIGQLVRLLILRNNRR